MLSLTGSARQLCDGLTRREFLRIGGVGLLELTLADVLAHQAQASGKFAKSCIFLFMEGAPAHQDTWDPKPNAPSEVRGEFKPIRTSVPGFHICEHLPMLAKVAHRYAIVRSVTHNIPDHNPAAYYALTGRSPVTSSGVILGDRRSNFPPYGAVLAKFRPSERPVPSFVHTPAILTNNGEDLPGQRGGFLGPAYDPFVVGDPTEPNFIPPGLLPSKEVPLPRLGARRALWQDFDRVLGQWGQQEKFRSLNEYQQRAFTLITSSATRAAFDLSKESPRTHERYGRHHLGQCMLLARRLIEAGVRLVTVCWGPKSGSKSNQSWDTHIQNFYYLKNSLLPPTDRCLSALIEDLHQRGLLDETLVVAMGEFGRTPKINKDAGRDHWPHCYSVFLAGGPIRGGAVYGASDQHAAYPVETPVTPEDIAATIYQALGLSPEWRVYDPQNRPHSIAEGQPIHALFG